MIGEHMSLHFALVLLRSGTFSTVAFDKLEALYFEDHLIQRLFRLFLPYVFVESLTIILDPQIHGDLASPIDIYSWMDRIFLSDPSPIIGYACH